MEKKLVGGFSLIIGVGALLFANNSYNEIMRLNYITFALATTGPFWHNGVIFMFFGFFTFVPGFSSSFVSLMLSLYSALLCMVIGLTILTGRASVAGVPAALILLTGVPYPMMFNLVNSSFPLSLRLDPWLFLLMFLSTIVGHTVSPVVGSFMVYELFLFMFYTLLLVDSLRFYNVVSAVVASVSSLMISVGFRSYAGRVKERRRKYLIGLLKSRDLSRIEGAASRLGIGRDELEALLIELISEDKVKGRITEDGEFVSGAGLGMETGRKAAVKGETMSGKVVEADESVAKLGKGEAVEKSSERRCPFCGVRVDRGRKTCHNCGGVLV